MRRSVRRALPIVTVAAAVVLSIVAPAEATAPATGGAPATADRSTSAESGVGAVPAECARTGGTGRARCFLALEPTPGPAVGGTATTCAVDEAAGYTPCNLQDAYGTTTLSAKNGKGSTVAVVDPGDDPHAGADLDVFRSAYQLPACTTANGCFKKVNQEGVAGGYPAPTQGAAQEISLDVEMVSAICPKCHILLVEANSNGFGDLGAAEDEAVALGADVVSNSWGTGEFEGESGWDGDWDHPGVAITFSSGDAAYQGGVQYPSASPYVTSVGGTELVPATNKRTWSETAWVTPAKVPTQGSGSGCSAYEPKPPWQHDSGCANRTTADVSAVAANVMSYDSYQANGWYYSFGTSVSSPIIAGMYALAHNPASIAVPASAAYADPGALYDVTKGSTGNCTPTYLCKAGPGYDGPTGLGTPHGIDAFKVPGAPTPVISGVTVSGPASSPTVTVSGTNFGAQPPIGTPETCNTGDTGSDFGPSGLWFEDVSQGWTAGQAGDCIGLMLDSWTASQVVFGFGNQYANYPAIASGDSVAVEVQGATFSGSP